MSVRIGVIGVGYLGQHHARIFSGLDNVELFGVSDTDVQKAAEIAEKYNCRSFQKYEDMIDSCDAISIVTPTTLHYRVAMDCLAGDKDLFIEKPITETVDEAAAVIAEAERKNLILQVGHLERYNPGILAASDLINTPRYIESERLSPFLGRGTDVDVTLDLMIHDIDIVLSIVGSKPIDIKAIGESVLTEKIDVAKVWLEFEDGCQALITASRLAAEKQRTLKIFQKDSYLAIDYQNQELKRYYKEGSAIKIDVIKPENKEPLKEELKDFVDCVEKRRKPMVSGTEAMAALSIAHRITAMLTSKS